MKNKEYLERKKAKKIRQHQYALSLLGLDPGAIYFSPSEIKDIIAKVEKETGRKVGDTVNYQGMNNG